MGRLIWLASYPKSGNTWLRAFLHNYLTDPATPHDINRLTELTTGERAAALYHRHDPRPAATYTPADAVRLRPLVHRDLMGNDPQRVFVKTHNPAITIGTTPLITPEVTDRAIYLLRDPRDIAISYAAHLGITLDAMIPLLADDRAVSGGTDHKILEFIGSWSRHVASWTANPHPKLLVLRYEDLLTDPTDGFTDVIRFLGATPDPARLHRAINFTRFETLQHQEQTTGFAERPPTATTNFFRTGTAGQWRTTLTARQRRRIERDHAVQMRRFEYL